MVTRIRTGALVGVDGMPVHAEVDISRGLPGFHLVGLPGAEVRESRERVLSALRNCGLRPPPGKITVNLAPAGMRKSGASFDLAIALGVLAAAGRLGKGAGVGDRSRALFLGELSLFGELRPVRGVLPMVAAAAETGVCVAVVPASQAAEAALVAGVSVVAAADLVQVVRWCRTGQAPTRAAPATGDPDAAIAAKAARDAARRCDACRQVADLTGQALVRKAAVVAAAGRHNLLLMGPPGTGKTRLARLLGHLQTVPEPREALEITRIHSAAGTLRRFGLVRARPFRAPHHTITRAGLVGGGSTLRPGEVTLAHRGLLFLDELAEFAPAVLEALREPLQEGTIAVARGTGNRRFPAEFQLVAAMNPCRCGYHGSGVRPCRCSPSARARYLGRLSGPFLDRFDLFVEMGAWEGAFATRASDGVGRRPETSDWRDGPDPVLLRAAGRRLAEWRAAGRPRLSRGGARFIDMSRGALGLSLRGVARCLRVAATLAALDAASRIEVVHLREALEFRRETLTWDASEA